MEHHPRRVRGSVIGALLTGCLGDDAGSNDPEADDPTVLDPDPEAEA
jgi:hypothetical protein